MPGKSTPRGNIRNCPWGYNCDKTWNDLGETEYRDVRFCDYCNQNVYQCKTQRDLIHSVLLNRCVAFHPKLIKAIKARHIDSDTDTSPGYENISTTEDLNVMGEVVVDYFSTPQAKSPEYAQMHDRLMGDDKPENLSYTLGEDGAINVEVDFPGDYDREFIVTIPVRQVEKLVKLMDEPDADRVLGTLSSKFRNTSSLTDWLDEQRIGWSFWAWPG